jgi:hypothetical protein
MEIITVNNINLATFAAAFLSFRFESPSIVMCNVQHKTYVSSHKNETFVRVKIRYHYVAIIVIL